MEGNSNNSDKNLDRSVDPTPFGSLLNVKTLGDLVKVSEHLPLNWSTLPKTPFFAPLLGYTELWYRSIVTLSILETRRRAQRNLTPAETEVVATQAGKYVVTMSYEVPLLAATTWWCERKGRATFRFPFYQPGGGFNHDAFPHPRFTLLRGAAARAMWHSTRFMLYGSVAHFFLSAFLGSYAMSVRGVEFQRDPRLADLRSSIAQTAAAKRERLPRRPLPGQPAPVTPSESQESHGEYTNANTPDNEWRDTESRGNAYPTGSFGGGAPQSAQRQQQPQTPPPPQPQQPQLPASGGYSDPEGFDDEGYHDDASPVAPSERRKGWQQAGGSAWDRIRAQASTGQPTSPPAQGWAGGRRGPPPPAARGNRQSNDDYTYNEGDEEKSYAREQAQKDFDDLLERERRGEGDSPGRRR